MDEREFEQAARNTEQINAAGLERVRQLLEPESHPDFDGKHCIDCDNPVLRACAIALMVAAGFVFDTAVAFVMLLALPPEPLLSAL